RHDPSPSLARPRPHDSEHAGPLAHATPGCSSGVSALMSRPRTLRELKASDYHPRTVKDELRGNLIARLRSGQRPASGGRPDGAPPLFPGTVGSGHTVAPQIVNAILSRHAFILLGLPDQPKSRC